MYLYKIKGKCIPVAKTMKLVKKKFVSENKNVRKLYIETQNLHAENYMKNERKFIKANSKDCKSSFTHYTL